MILERQNFMSIPKTNDNIKRVIGPDNVKQLQDMGIIYQLCQSGANEVGTKLENLDTEFQFKHDHNPIHHMEERMKDVQSLFTKMKRKGLELSAQSVRDNIFDVAGIRVITNYLDDVYLIEKMLLQQSDVTLLKRKDYIRHPKDSGYRSLHLVVSVPVFQTDGVHNVPVEIQIRTVGMDMWASLEHKLRYKTDSNPEVVAKYADQIQGFSDEITSIEQRMQKIYQHLS